MGMILLRIGCGRRGVVVVSRRRPTISSHAIEELEDLTGAVEVHDEIRIVSATEADDLHSLATKRMMGMGDGDESRGRLG
jgi:hypothetical protein